MSTLIDEREWFLMRLFMVAMFGLAVAGFLFVVYGLVIDTKRAGIDELERTCVDAGRVFVHDQLGATCAESREAVQP